MAVTLTDLAEEKIRKLITSGEVGFMEKLSIRRLSQALHIGFQPVQDALKRLEQQGYVVIIGHPAPPKQRGSFVVRTK